METLDLYDTVANRTINKIERINKVLSSCQVEPKFAKEESETLFEGIMKINTDEIIVKEKNFKQYDLSKVSAMLKTLDLHVKSIDQPKKKNRSGSVSSLASDDNNRDYMMELRNHLKTIRQILGHIENTSIEIIDEAACTMEVTSSNNNFFELVFALQKLAREMTSIASTDNIPSENLQLSLIDSKFIDHLKQLDKCLDEMQNLDKNKNPVTNLKNKGNLKLEFTAIINNILEAIEINSL